LGEGAGYAGGIVSAAVDGLRSAMAVIAKLRTAQTSEVFKTSEVFGHAQAADCNPRASPRYDGGMGTILDREEYIEQAYFFRTLRERMMTNMGHARNPGPMCTRKSCP